MINYEDPKEMHPHEIENLKQYIENIKNVAIIYIENLGNKNYNPLYYSLYDNNIKNIEIYNLNFLENDKIHVKLKIEFGIEYDENGYSSERYDYPEITLLYDDLNNIYENLEKYKNDNDEKIRIKNEFDMILYKESLNIKIDQIYSILEKYNKISKEKLNIEDLLTKNEEIKP
jgi:hypothetical protein